jgi:DNA polymerase-3 subunit delta'
MNHFAANALLKTLEEPPARTHVLLVTSQPSRLLPTLRSRCSRLRLLGPPRELAAAFLEAARGPGPWLEALAATGAGPFALLDADPAAIAQLHRDTMATLRDIGSGNLQPPAVADRWSKAELPIRLACLESWVTERILESGSIRDVTLLSGQGIQPNICRLFELSDAVRDMRKLSHTSINKTMAVEALLWRWARQ